MQTLSRLRTNRNRMHCVRISKWMILCRVFHISIAQRADFWWMISNIWVFAAHHIASLAPRFVCYWISNFIFKAFDHFSNFYFRSCSTDPNNVFKIRAAILRWSKNAVRCRFQIMKLQLNYDACHCLKNKAFVHTRMDDNWLRSPQRREYTRRKTAKAKRPHYTLESCHTISDFLPFILLGSDVLAHIVFY